MFDDPNNSESFLLEAMMGFNVNRTAHLMSEAIAERFKTRGFTLTAQDFGILYRLWRQDGLKQKEIAALMGRDKTTITRRLDGLVKKKLLERRADSADRRIFRIHLTHEGKIVVRHLIDAVQRFHRELTGEIPEEDWQTTLRTLQAISHKITQG
jgi:MarR family transcriptional regulator for hemolysin